jgi:CDP-L-myo-inositol myo-inositolphosphotransferase
MATAAVAGIPLLARTVLTLARSGIGPITVVGDGTPAAAFAPVRAAIARVAPALDVAWVETAEADPFADATRRVIVMRCDGIFDSAMLDRLLERGRRGNAFMAFGDDDAGLWMLGADDAQRLVRGEAVAHAALRARAGDYAPVHGPGDVVAAERRLFAWCVKPTDGLVSRYLNRPLSTWISRHLARFDILPQHLTVLTAALALTTFACLVSGSIAGLIAGCVLFHVTSVADGLDGEIARAKFMTSETGAALDTGVDMASNLLFMIGVSIGDAAMFGRTYAWLGLIAAVTAIAAIGAMALTLRLGPGGGSFDVLQLTIQQRLAAWPRLRRGFLYVNAVFKRDLFAFLFALLGLSGRPQAIPWLLAFGTGAWLLTVLVNVPAMLRANREDVLPPHLRTRSLAES